MDYHAISEGRFLSRPNRFIAQVERQGQEVTVHVKNTGRCAELLQPGALVYLEESSNPNRKTRFDLVAVWKGKLLVNMDAQAPNTIFREWAEAGDFLPNLSLLQGEKTFQNSRFDFYWEEESDGVKVKGFTEIKGVTLESQGIACFPDAPTQRGVKHLRELIAARQAGYQASVCFVVQMEGMRQVVPNWRTHPEFGRTLIEAREAGVEVFALDCQVGTDFLRPGKRLPVVLEEN